MSIKLKQQQVLNVHEHVHINENVAEPIVKLICIISLIILIYGCILFDIVFLTSRSDIKFKEVKQKGDSLELLLDEKLPQIYKAIEIQQQQLKELKVITEK